MEYSVSAIIFVLGVTLKKRSINYYLINRGTVMEPQPSELFKKVFKKRTLAHLLKVKEIIVDEQNLFDMNCWEIPIDVGDFTDPEGEHPRLVNRCGTARCIGGWLNTIADIPDEASTFDFYTRVSNEQTGRKLLFNLFYPQKAWQDEMDKDWDGINGSERRSGYRSTPEQACRVIDRFITYTEDFED